MELDDNIYAEITRLSEEGDTLAISKNYNDAIKKYKTAFEMLPNPKQDWEASTWLYVAIGDALYLDHKYDEALHCMLESQKCPDGIGNPFICIRIGQCFFELKQYEKAKKYLLQAYMLDGLDIFHNEDKKYIELIKELIKR